MYGAEFDSNFFASNANDEDVPCALCRTERASSVIMIPGKNKCYSGWKEEYHGYLASGLYNHVAASAFVNQVTIEEKRLLLNDPDVLVNRQNHVENIVAMLNATVRQLTTENKQHVVTNQRQEKPIQQQQFSIKQQQNTSIQQHQTLIQQH
ncbi:Hypothetical predicted protein [Mytilus galloprovincialis]|nr:Hypothetical predicted protein [Mytilus galloprovincialis]